MESDDADAYNARGSSYAKKGEWGHAVKDFTRAVNLRPNYAMVYNNLGLAYAATNELDQSY